MVVLKTSESLQNDTTRTSAGSGSSRPITIAGGANKRPNVVILLADDLGFRDVGYNGAEFETPHIDKLSREGLPFNRFYSFPLCPPTRAGLMTGRHPVRFGLTYSVVRPWSHYGLSAAEKTIADVFHENGYRTSIIGKWHLGYTHKKLLPQSRGCDRFYGHVNGAIDYFTHRRNDSPAGSATAKRFRRLATAPIGWRRKHRGGSRSAIRIGRFFVPAVECAALAATAPEDLLKKYASIQDPRRRTYAAMVDAPDHGIGREGCGLARSHGEEDRAASAGRGYRKSASASRMGAAVRLGEGGGSVTR